MFFPFVFCFALLSEVFKNKSQTLHFPVNASIYSFKIQRGFVVVVVCLSCFVLETGSQYVLEA